MGKNGKLSEEEASRIVRILRELNTSFVQFLPEGGIESTGLSEESEGLIPVGQHLSGCLYPDFMVRKLSEVWTEGKADFRYRFCRENRFAPLRMELYGSASEALGLVTETPADDERRMADDERMRGQIDRLIKCADAGIAGLGRLIRKEERATEQSLEDVREEMYRVAVEWQDVELEAVAPNPPPKKRRVVKPDF